MPAYELRLAEPQEEREELERRLSLAVRECTEVGIVARNHVKRFLMEYGVWQLSEMDYLLRLKYENYLKKNKASVADLTCLHAFDKLKIHTMKREMQTLEGRKKYELKYTDKILFLPYYPEIEVAEQFVKSKNKEGLVWDFTIQCCRYLKEQIFICLNYVLTAYETWERKEKLKALQYLYGYCEKIKLADLELMTLEQEKNFVGYLPKELSKRNMRQILGIIELCRKILFLQADQTHWYAQVWYLERFHFSKERINPSNIVGRISFRPLINDF